MSETERLLRGKRPGERERGLALLGIVTGWPPNLSVLVLIPTCIEGLGSRVEPPCGTAGLPPMTRSPVELVIFDCDGVLVDSERICVKVDAMITADLGCAFTEAEIIERFVGSSDEVYTAAVEQRLGRRLEKDWQQKYEHLYRTAFDAELTAVDGIAEVLNGLTTPVCVASNGDHDGIRRNLELVALSDHFAENIFSADDVAMGKPAPDLFLHAARSMGADPGRCAVIEDSAYGVRAARAAGMRAFGYCGGLTPASRLEGPRTTVFDDMRELPGLLAAATG